MVLLVEKLNKICSKLENHLHHHHHEAEDQASLQAFRSDVSICLNQLLENSKPGPELLSLSWVQQCFELLPIMNKAFAKLVAGIDYPMSRWGGKSMEEYLNYSLYLLDLLNLIMSSISQLVETRLELSHALSLMENSPALSVDCLRAIQAKKINSTKELKEPTYLNFYKVDEKERPSSNKEKIIHQALMEIRSIGLWVCGVILTALSGDEKLYMEMRKSQGFSVSSSADGSLSSLDSTIQEVIMEKKGVVVKEVRELNGSAAGLTIAIETEESSDDVAKELQRRLEEFEQMMEKLRKEVNGLFSKVLAGRNELLDGIRPQKQQ